MDSIVSIFDVDIRIPLQEIICPQYSTSDCRKTLKNFLTCSNMPSIYTHTEYYVVQINSRHCNALKNVKFWYAAQFLALKKKPNANFENNSSMRGMGYLSTEMHEFNVTEKCA
ncbi:hypothetical protein RF11_03058 [Thelohanellus kitauei]|uniref:Uncharacterized protein n=1 Tax=Thelohanellus kitauei TaxID=669202 RepID=A0A0C2N4M0_THEKT|nr:hypothetical protein RF11_03058 [Thelohanellus kitauei]